jgi:hypothetical protein
MEFKDEKNQRLLDHETKPQVETDAGGSTQFGRDHSADRDGISQPLRVVANRSSGANSEPVWYNSHHFLS